MFKRPLLHSLILSALACAASASQASLVYYSTQAGFLAATSGTSVDTFSDLTFASLTTANRTVGDDSYRIWAPSAPGNTGKTNMLVASESPVTSNSPANAAVSVYYYGVPMQIDNFASSSTPVQAIGGNFFNVGSAATYLAGSVTLTALDSDGLTLTRSVSPAYNARTGLVTSFEGFVTTATLVSLTLTPASTSPQRGYGAAVDNLTLGSGVAPAVQGVPEPASCVLALIAIGAMGAIRGRRRSPARGAALALHRQGRP